MSSVAVMAILSKTNLFLIATGLIMVGAMNVSAVVSTLAIGCALTLAGIAVGGKLPAVTGTEDLVGSALALVGVLGLLGPPLGTYPPSITSERPILLVTGTVTCIAAMALRRDARGRRVATIAALGVAVLVVSLIAAREWNSDLGSDVYHAHRSAGRALANFENPYTDAVRFEDGNPFAPDRILYGYPYPPVVLLLYGMTAIPTDPRLVSAIAWLAVLAWLGWRASSDNERVSRSSLGLLMILALAPLGGFVWYMAWTEPLTLVLFLAAALTWKQSAISSGTFLGLALASKQYLVLLAPFLVFHREQGSRRRALIAMLVAALTLSVALIPDARAFLQATIGNLSQIGFRPDTQSLSGLLAVAGIEFLLPNVIWIAVSLIITSLLARSSRSRSGFLIRAGLGLGVSFMLGMAFPNYWFLIAGMIGLGAVLAVEDEQPVARPA